MGNSSKTTARTTWSNKSTLNGEEKVQPAIAIALFRSAVTARMIDQLEETAVNQGHAFFQVSSTGHEAVAGISSYLRPQDWIHAHYRDKAPLLARGVPVRAFFDKISRALLTHHDVNQKPSEAVSSTNNIFQKA